MDKERVFEGEWFIPGKVEEKIFGTLKYEPNERIILSAFEGFEKEFFLEDLHHIKIIHGKTIDGKRITLFNCIEIFTKSDFKQKKYSKWNVDYVFIGHYFDNESDIKSYKTSAYFPILTEWMFKNGHQLSTKLYSRSFDLKYESPLDIKYKIDNDYEIEFYFHIVHDLSARNSFKSQQKNLVSIISDESKDFFEVIKKIYSFQDLITLLSFRPIYLSSLHILNNDNDYPIEVLIAFNKIKEDKKLLFISKYSELEDNFEEILKKWYDLEKKAPEILGLFSEIFYNEGRILENRFLNLVQAIESFHRKLRKNFLLEPDDFKAKVNEIVNSVPEKYKSYVKEKLNFGNEPTLHNRLDELLAEVPNEVLNILIFDKETFIKNIKQTRNYYTHYDDRLKQKALQGQDLFNLIEKSKVLFLIILLQEIGFNKDQIQYSVNVIKSCIKTIR